MDEEVKEDTTLEDTAKISNLVENTSIKKIHNRPLNPLLKTPQESQIPDLFTEAGNEKVTRGNSFLKPLAEGPRCGLCGGGADGEPPWELICPQQDRPEKRGGQGAKEATWRPPLPPRGSEVAGELGPLLGPLSERIGVAGVWVHRECAIWSPEVYFCGIGQLRHVQAAVRRGRMLRCTRCARNGATLGCQVERCPRTYHLPCGRLEGCYFDHEKYLLTCPEHHQLMHSRKRKQHLAFCMQMGSYGLHMGGENERKLAAIIAERRATAAVAAAKDTEEEERRAEAAGDDEDFRKREQRRMDRDLSRIVPIFLGGRQRTETEGRERLWENVGTGVDGWRIVERAKSRSRGTEDKKRQKKGGEFTMGWSDEERQWNLGGKWDRWLKERGAWWSPRGRIHQRPIMEVEVEEARKRQRLEDQAVSSTSRGVKGIDSGGFRNGREREGKRHGEVGSTFDDVFRGGTDTVSTSIGNEGLTGWDSIAGLRHVIDSLKEMIFLPLLYSKFFESRNLTPPRGVLLHGPPGTGKTLVARALAQECKKGLQKIAFFARNGADCLGKYVGDAERQLRLLFQVAEENQPAIIFFDEIDGLAPIRTKRHEDQTQASVVSTLLALMDGLHSRGSVVVIAATNRLSAIDTSLRRPGRFDREIHVPLPSASDRAAILALHTKTWPVPLSNQLADAIAKVTPGFAGADLKALCSAAAMVALRRECPLGNIHTGEEIALKLVQGDHKVDKVKNFTGQPKLPSVMSVQVLPSDWRRALKEAPPPCSQRFATVAVKEAAMAAIPDFLSPLLGAPLAGLLLGIHCYGEVRLPTAIAQVPLSLLKVMDKLRNGGGISKQMCGSMLEKERLEELLMSDALNALRTAGLVEGKRHWNWKRSTVMEYGTKADTQKTAADCEVKQRRGRLEGVDDDHETMCVKQNECDDIGREWREGGRLSKGLTGSRKRSYESSGRSHSVIPVGGGMGRGFKVLISGEAGQGQAQLSMALLQALEAMAAVKILSLPSMILEGGGEILFGLSRIMDEVHHAAPCVLFLPRVETWAVCSSKESPESPLAADLADQAGGSATSATYHAVTSAKADALATSAASVSRWRPQLNLNLPAGEESSSQGVNAKDGEIPDNGVLKEAACELDEREIGDVSGEWKVFLQQMRSIPVDRSMYIVATTHVPGKNLPSEVLSFFTSSQEPMGSNLSDWMERLRGRRTAERKINMQALSKKSQKDMTFEGVVEGSPDQEESDRARENFTKRGSLSNGFPVMTGGRHTAGADWPSASECQSLDESGGEEERETPQRQNEDIICPGAVPCLWLELSPLSLEKLNLGRLAAVQEISDFAVEQFASCVMRNRHVSGICEIQGEGGKGDMGNNKVEKILYEKRTRIVEEIAVREESRGQEAEGKGSSQGACEMGKVETEAEEKRPEDKEKLFETGQGCGMDRGEVLVNGGEGEREERLGEVEKIEGDVLEPRVVLTIEKPQLSGQILCVSGDKLVCREKNRIKVVDKGFVRSVEINPGCSSSSEEAATAARWQSGNNCVRIEVPGETEITVDQQPPWQREREPNREQNLSATFQSCAPPASPQIPETSGAGKDGFAPYLPSVGMPRTPEERAFRGALAWCGLQLLTNCHLSGLRRFSARLSPSVRAPPWKRGDSRTPSSGEGERERGNGKSVRNEQRGFTDPSTEARAQEEGKRSDVAEGAMAENGSVSEGGRRGEEKKKAGGMECEGKTKWVRGLAAVGLLSCHGGYENGAQLLAAVRSVAGTVKEGILGRGEGGKPRTDWEGERMMGVYHPLLAQAAALEDMVACWTRALPGLEYAAKISLALLPSPPLQRKKASEMPLEEENEKGTGATDQPNPNTEKLELIGKPTFSIITTNRAEMLERSQFNICEGEVADEGHVMFQGSGANGIEVKEAVKEMEVGDKSSIGEDEEAAMLAAAVAIEQMRQPMGGKEENGGKDVNDNPEEEGQGEGNGASVKRPLSCSRDKELTLDEERFLGEMTETVERSLTEEAGNIQSNGEQEEKIHRRNTEETETEREMREMGRSSGRLTRVIVYERKRKPSVTRAYKSSSLEAVVEKVRKNTEGNEAGHLFEDEKAQKMRVKERRKEVVGVSCQSSIESIRKAVEELFAAVVSNGTTCLLEEFVQNVSETGRLVVRALTNAKSSSRTACKEAREEGDWAKPVHEINSQSQDGSGSLCPYGKMKEEVCGVCPANQLLCSFHEVSVREVRQIGREESVAWEREKVRIHLEPLVDAIQEQVRFVVTNTVT